MSSSCGPFIRIPKLCFGDVTVYVNFHIGPERERQPVIGSDKLHLCLQPTCLSKQEAIRLSAITIFIHSPSSDFISIYVSVFSAGGSNMNPRFSSMGLAVWWTWEGTIYDWFNLLFTNISNSITPQSIHWLPPSDSINSQIRFKDHTDAVRY